MAPIWQGQVGSATGTGSTVDVTVGTVNPGWAIVLWITFHPRILSSTTLSGGINYFDMVDWSVTKTNNAAFAHAPSAQGFAFAEWYNSQQTSGIRNINSGSANWYDPIAPITSGALAADLPGGIHSSVQAVSDSSAFTQVRVNFFKRTKTTSNAGASSVTYDIKAYRVRNLIPKTTTDPTNNTNAIYRTEPMSINCTPAGHAFPGTTYAFVGTQNAHLESGTHIGASDGGDTQNTTSPASVTFGNDQVINFGLAGYWGQLTTSGYSWNLWPGTPHKVATISLPALDGYADAYFELWYRIIDPPASDNVEATGTFGTSTDTQTLPPGTGGSQELYFRATTFTQPFWSNPGTFNGRSMRTGMLSILASDPIPQVFGPNMVGEWSTS